MNQAESTIKAPNHVAIVMDGNGRWAQDRLHSRAWGHIRGAKVISSIVEEAIDLDIKALTLYAFSTENWSRPLPEIKIIFSLLKKYLIKERAQILNNNIRFNVIGDTSKLPVETNQLIASLEQDTSSSDGLNLTFAFGYGGRAEIISAVNQFIKSTPDKVPMTEEDLTNNLMAPQNGDVDLLIRTGGDQRISNFLLWQVAYAELFFTQTKWPNFNRFEFREICQQFGTIERRFGGVGPGQSYEHGSKLAHLNMDRELM
ncbi:MAG: di-trans,poly-cis-decaprenylcistransferase [Bacteriovoracaceae bacterium]|nr:di-trans,poly-cis-decaprenylcistransferase [Bacteriovoracaceae bacterium]